MAETPIATTTAFQQRMFEKIRDSIGDLMTDAELKTLLDAAIQEAFFKPQVTNRDGYGRNEMAPSLLVQETQKLLKERFDTQLREYMEAHADEIAKAIDEVLSKGFIGMMHSYIERSSAPLIQQFGNDIRARLGLPQTY